MQGDLPTFQFLKVYQVPMTYSQAPGIRTWTFGEPLLGPSHATSNAQFEDSI